MLDELAYPFRRCLALAWESCMAGTIGVGAVVTDPEGDVIAEGRNRIFDRPGGVAALQGSRIAHAELNALAAVPERVSLADCTLWTSLQPCLMCSSAAVLAGVGMVRYLAPDPLFIGIEGVPELNAFIRARWPSYHGPDEAEWSLIAGLLAHHLLAFWDPRSAGMAALARHEPEVAALLQRVVADRTLSDAASRHDRLDAVVDELWPLAVEAHGQRVRRTV